MKAMAMRIDAADPKDLADLKGLIRSSGYATAAEVIAVVEAHYPHTRIPPKTRFGIEEIVDALNTEKGARS